MQIWIVGKPIQHQSINYLFDQVVDLAGWGRRRRRASHRILHHAGRHVQVLELNFIETKILLKGTVW